jgi:hypothetical protein
MEKQLTSRRELFRGALRALTLGGLGYIAVGQLTKRVDPDQQEKCFNQGICGKCRLLANCNLPQALSARQAERKYQKRVT